MSQVVTKAILYSAQEGIIEEKPLHHSEPSSFLCGLKPTPFGKLVIVMADNMLCGVGVVDGEKECYGVGKVDQELECYRDELAYLMKPWKASPREANDETADITAHLLQPGSKPLLLLMRGTPLQISVWLELLKTKRGETLSYQELANRVGRPTAVRAVANAVGANRLGYIVPCHRVIRSSGHIGGFRWDISYKKRFLEEEAKEVSI